MPVDKICSSCHWYAHGKGGFCIWHMADKEYNDTCGYWKTNRYAGYEAGQKTISPEVREKIQNLLDVFCRQNCPCIACNFPKPCSGDELKKLLDKE